MNLVELNAKEWVLLSLRAEERHQGILRGKEDTEETRRRLTTSSLRQIRLRRTDAQMDWPRVWHLDERAILQLLQHHVPALFRTGSAREPRRAEGEILGLYAELSTVAREANAPELDWLFDSLAARPSDFGRARRV